MGPLAGVRIVEVASVVMAPFACRILGDMGADVVKVEPLSGDTIRAIGPMRNPRMGHLFLHANRNKRSLALDLKSQEGAEAMRRLVQTADVLIYNVRPAAMQRLGLGYEELSAIHPKLIYVGAYGFGQSGPYAARPAYDDLIQGLAGIPSLVARTGDGNPRYVPLAIADRYVGLATVNAVLGALLARGRTGRGQSIEVPMFETMVECVMGDHSGGETFEPPIGPAGYARSLAPERKPFATLDGYICAMLYTDQQWRAFFQLVNSEMRNDPRFATLTSRTKHAGPVHQYLQEVLRTRTTSEWLRNFEELDIPATVLHTLETIPGDPHLTAVDFFQWHEHPTEGPLRYTRSPATWSDTPMAITRHPPTIGEHSVELLEELGYSSTQIEEFFEAGVTCGPSAVAAASAA
ncbi:CaiB/BaiF CoA transferase family protein [Variovorax sp. VNK109]|uniref:CaiB/BaiF CoA transferase family protein n=1 Tax=Variovorax sp. VNK109 TaxID=3400919 RepID=UPI003C030709